MPEPVFERLLLVGLGLIGSSIARIARERQDLAREVVAHDQPAVLDRVAALGLADRVEPDLARAVAGARAVGRAAVPGDADHADLDVRGIAEQRQAHEGGDVAEARHHRAGDRLREGWL